MCTYIITHVAGCIVFVDENRQTEDDNEPKIFSALFPCRLNANGEFYFFTYHLQKAYITILSSHKDQKVQIYSIIYACTYMVIIINSSYVHTYNIK